MNPWLFLLVQVLTLQYAFSAPVRDYIIAYIPVEELPYLANIEPVPITQYEIILPEGYGTSPVIYIDEPTYYTGPFSSIGGSYYLDQGFPVYSVSSAVPAYYIPAISVLPAVSVPTITVSTPTIFSTSPCSFSTSTTLYANQNDINEAVEVVLPDEEVINPVEKVILPVEEVVLPVAESVPISGSVAFKGKVPASGKVNIYASFY